MSNFETTKSPTVFWIGGEALEPLPSRVDDLCSALVVPVAPSAGNLLQQAMEAIRHMSQVGMAGDWAVLYLTSADADALIQQGGYWENDGQVSAHESSMDDVVTLLKTVHTYMSGYRFNLAVVAGPFESTSERVESGSEIVHTELVRVASVTAEELGVPFLDLHDSDDLHATAQPVADFLTVVSSAD